MFNSKNKKNILLKDKLAKGFITWFQNWHRDLIIKILRNVAAVIILVFIVLSLGIHWGNWRDPAILKAVSFISYPAALVNGKIITLQDVLDQERALSVDYSMLPKDLADNNPLTTQALNRAIQIEVLSQAAQQFNITVSDTEVAQYMKNLVANFGSPVAIESLVQKQYNWNLNIYVEKVVKPTIIQQKLEEYWENMSPNKEAYEKIQELYYKVSLNPQKFEELAGQYNQDQTAAIKGDIGWLGYGDMIPELQKVIISLKPGEISPVITSNQGYHILKVDQQVKDNQGREIWRAYQIFFKRIPFSQYLTETIKKAKVVSLLKT